MSLIQDQKDQIFTHCPTFGAAQNRDQNRTKETDPHACTEKTSKIYRGLKIRYSFAAQKFLQILVVITSQVSQLHNAALYWTGN